MSLGGKGKGEYIVDHKNDLSHKVALLIEAVEEDSFITIGLFDSNNILSECFDLWIDTDMGFYCVQELLVFGGEVEEIGETKNYVRYELERLLLDWAVRGQLKRIY